MNAPTASLPMYDWPEIRDATDYFWTTLYDSFSDFGFSPPKNLTRPEDSIAFWQGPGLFFSQTCGLPFIEKLSGKVSLVGTPAYDIDCGAGSYFSVIAVHKESHIESLHDLEGAIFGYNDPLSQSGIAAFFFHLASNGLSPGKLGRCERVMSHRNAIRQLAEKHIDVASIDAVTWEIAKRHEDATSELKVIARTDPTPGLPFITAHRPKTEVDKIHHAVVEAMASLPGNVQDKLILTGLAATEENDYSVIGDRFESIRTDLQNCL